VLDMLLQWGLRQSCRNSLPRLASQDKATL